VSIYLFFVIVLIILAISDLVVGISNDAVNFTNSAVGSRVASMNVILAIAGLGVIVGATFSSGMMEIARSGIFHPGKFTFSEIMLIFLAVMITDVILLDTFNTFGFPTSTTVSIVFELLGAAVAISLVKIYNTSGNLADLGNYINSAKALAIISGILVSVVIAFTFGTVVMFLTRLIFSFNYEKYMKYFGALWGGLAITSIIYFMLVKGAKGASFMTSETVEWLNSHTWQVLLYSFVITTSILHILIVAFNVNILKIIVLTGTFSLAMAFAGNDLVNFIGVPLAGYESYKAFASDPSVNPDTLMMGSLQEPLKTPTIFLLAAGIIMVLTLFVSKKARTVTQTEVTLARQDEGYERFSSSPVSRFIVRVTVNFSRSFKKILPTKLLLFIEKRFDSSQLKKKSRTQKDAPSFDMLRASVNMFVASSLIATGTSLKLPLSTTYVTFMVAMGASLADRAWGRESAVYRISGVISVITGWFITAFVAFTVSFLIALFLNWGGLVAFFILLAASIIFIIRTNFIHKKIFTQLHKKDEFDTHESLSFQNVIQKCSSTIYHITEETSKIYFSTLINLIKHDRKKMKKNLKRINEIDTQTREIKNNTYKVLRKLEEESLESGYFYVQAVDSLKELTHCLKFITEPVFEHIDNNHPPLHKEQIKDLHLLNEEVASLFDDILAAFQKQNPKYISKIDSQHKYILDLIAKLRKKQIKIIKDETISSRNAMMFLNLLSESRNLVNYATNLVKSHNDFIAGEGKYIIP